MSEEEVNDGGESVTDTGTENTDATETTEQDEGAGTDNQDPATDTEGEQPSEGDGESDGDGSGDAEGDEGEETDEVEPNLTFKAGVYNKETKSFEQKEFQIDPKFKDIMKDPESEKLVRELHEKAFGLDSVKERYNEIKQVATEMTTENKEIKHQLGKLGQTYRSAVQSGNLHKLDNFFAQMNVPQEVILQYAIAKAELQEMDPMQRQAIEGRLRAETQAETLAEQQERISQQHSTQEAQIKELQMASLMVRPDISTVAKSFDDRFGKPGSFQAEVVRTGQLAWFQRRQNLTPEQAINEVIRMHGLTASAPANGQNSNAGANGQGGKPIIQRGNGTKTLPNISGRTASPLKSKPRSVDDLKKLYKEMASD